MGKTTKVPGSCALCWESKHGCKRMTSSYCCKRCSNPMSRGEIDSRMSISSILFTEEAIMKQFQGHGFQQPRYTFGTNGLETGDLGLDIRSPSLSRRVKFCVHICGPFDTCNSTLMSSFDDMVSKKFCAKLEDVEPGSKLVSIAALAGGYLHLLCSTKDIEEQVETFVDGVPVLNTTPDYNLHLHFRFLLICRIRELVDQVLGYAGFLSDNVPHSSSVYAATEILHLQVDFFKCSLKHGMLSRHVPAGLEGPFLDWMTSLERELKTRVRAGCGKFPNWRAAIKGSLKKLRRVDEVLSMTMRLQQNKTSPETHCNWEAHHALPAPLDETRLSYQAILSSDTGLGPQDNLFEYYDQTLMDKSIPSLRMTESPPTQPTHSTMEYDFGPPIVDQLSDPVLYDPEIENFAALLDPLPMFNGYHCYESSGTDRRGSYSLVDPPYAHDGLGTRLSQPTPSYLYNFPHDYQHTRALD